VRDHPLFGIGFNTYRFAQLRYGFITKGEEADSHGVAGTDNSFLFVLATTGLIGLLSYAALWGTIVRQAWGNHVVVASITAIFIHSLFVNSLFYPHIMEWIWILIAAS
jgi:O-antigen ligase